MNTKHTPSPWRVMPVDSLDFRRPNEDGARDMVIVAENGICTGIVWEYGAEGEANAKLKAAAPDLARSLQWVLDFVNEPAIARAEPLPDCIVDDIRAVLAKAGL